MRKYGYKVYYGDAARRAAAFQARRRRSADSHHVYEPEDTMKLVALCQQHFPHLHILRERVDVEAHELLQAGVTQFSPETFSSALNWDVKLWCQSRVCIRISRNARSCIFVIGYANVAEPILSIATWQQISRARGRRELE